MTIEIEADLDADGEIVDWRHSIWSNGHTARPGRATTPALLAATELANPFPRTISTNPPQANGGGADRNSIPLYDLPAWRIESHRLTTMPVRTSALRTLGAQGNVFAIESFIDEIAAERGDDPVAFRLRHLSDMRARDVIRRCRRRARTGSRASNQVAVTGSALRDTRTPAPIAPSSPRSRAPRISASSA